MKRESSAGPQEAAPSRAGCAPDELLTFVFAAIFSAFWQKCLNAQNLQRRDASPTLADLAISSRLLLPFSQPHPTEEKRGCSGMHGQPGSCLSSSGAITEDTLQLFSSRSPKRSFKSRDAELQLPLTVLVHLRTDTDRQRWAAGERGGRGAPSLLPQVRLPTAHGIRKLISFLSHPIRRNRSRRSCIPLGRTAGHPAKCSKHETYKVTMNPRQLRAGILVHQWLDLGALVMWASVV